MDPSIRNEEITVYGHRVCFRAAGEGPVLVLVHGITGSSAQWAPVMPLLAERYTVVAPDLLGHGESAKPRGDYSLGAYATGIRDLLIALEHPKAAVVLADVLGRLRLRPGNDLAEMAAGIGSLAESDARQAFLHTLRAVIDPRGQRVNATDRLHLAEVMPSLIVWGERDPIIPVEHAHVAHAAMPGSRLELLEEAGHFPQLDDPITLARLLTDFVESTEPADVRPEGLRDLVLG